MKIDINLLDNFDSLRSNPGDLNACLNAHGLYNSFQFVLRLSPEVHRRIDAMPYGISTGPHDFDGVQAFSTYLHETMHWWQHIGSTLGLMLSLSYPAQAHTKYNHLKNFLARIGPKKSILRFVENIVAESKPDTPLGLANTIVNNHFDIEFFRGLITDPMMASEAAKHPLFHCLGHSYSVTYSNVIFVLASTFDLQFEFLPNPMNWEEEFITLRSQKRTGHYWGSDIIISPIGARKIFEGQARFAQLQYLHFASGGVFNWDEVNAGGMLNDVYGEAFEVFLRLAELSWPDTIDDPIVALFLLVCDIAINASSGFPMSLQVATTFIKDVDPGLRFIFLARAIATQCPEVAQTITTYSYQEYSEVSNKLCLAIKVDTPLQVADMLSKWVCTSKNLSSLMEEYRTFDYTAENSAIRLLFSHFLAFNLDKLLKPEFFCWPGAWMAGERLTTEIEPLFNRHTALFMDKMDDDSIFPRIISGKDDATVYKAFNNFYGINLTYDMTRQWIAIPGPFGYNYQWLSSSATKSAIKSFADGNFHSIYGVHPDDFNII